MKETEESSWGKLRVALKAALIDDGNMMGWNAYLFPSYWYVVNICNCPALCTIFCAFVP